MIERTRLNGLQDRRLESSRGKSTPTTESDIGLRARLYKSLVEGVVIASMAYEGMQGGRGTQEMIDSQVGQIRAGRREAVLAGFNLDGFDLVVKDKIQTIKDKAREEAEDADFQARLGDVPANINFGNHAHKKEDAGGFEPPRRRGW